MGGVVVLLMLDIGARFAAVLLVLPGKAEPDEDHWSDELPVELWITLIVVRTTVTSVVCESVTVLVNEETRAEPWSAAVVDAADVPDMDNAWDGSGWLWDDDSDDWMVFDPVDWEAPDESMIDGGGGCEVGRSPCEGIDNDSEDWEVLDGELGLSDELGAGFDPGLEGPLDVLLPEFVVARFDPALEGLLNVLLPESVVAESVPAIEGPLVVLLPEAGEPVFVLVLEEPLIVSLAGTIVAAVVRPALRDVNEAGFWDALSSDEVGTAVVSMLTRVDPEVEKIPEKLVSALPVRVVPAASEDLAASVEPRTPELVAEGFENVAVPVPEELGSAVQSDHDAGSDGLLAPGSGKGVGNHTWRVTTSGAVILRATSGGVIPKSTSRYQVT
jgi:hypothetical protein